MNLIFDTILAHVPLPNKKTSGGWISFNCVACVHNGTSADTRGRAGIIVTEDRITYSCFNCGYKTSWAMGKNLSNNFRNLMSWMGISNDHIHKCQLEAIRAKELGPSYKIATLTPEFFTRSLPEGARPISEWIDNPVDGLYPILEYLQSRGLYLDDYNWYWSDQGLYKNRLIIPFMYRNRIVGYTARSISPNTKLKYLNDQQPGYVFNLDKQDHTRKFVILSEGPMDAISVDGIATMGNTISSGQHWLISQLKREVVVVPDRDDAGQKLVECAIKHSWSVSFPNWDDDIKDINNAIIRYGRLYTMYNIVTSKQVTPFKIKLLSKTWFK